MKKIVLGMHVSLDGFVAGPAGEMDWIYHNADMFEIAGQLTEQADTALYGRVTYEMMEAYWPTAADKPNATKHDLEHSRWYKGVNKVVISKSMAGQTIDRTRIIGDDVAGQIKKLKEQSGKNIQIFGSPSVCHILMQHDLIDTYWLFVNSILLGKGIPFFKLIEQKTKLKLVESHTFGSEVIGMHYNRV